ncbi:Octanoate-[acyl-carrier-protein]-protein-N-octanoyltransferase [Candidatus Accumulibacter phosphatis]|uniref:Octanoate-[acyl-carrier-protein]-protein-N-octanoyltransferase n=1 Tax=Candidatus Accumulibacter phosphatis TaxID=327160 RepID=A0A5S4EI02_9PROT|nr:Octanoate-[acyl-carrier-protein]-protein-N-octanoyltransferase [Candidatus Accumulibacter phosphatis]
MTAFVVKHLGRVEYAPTFAAMQEFTARRDATTADEIWLCEHPPVVTLGLSGNIEHRLADAGIPMVRIDRCGQIAYHGPGQVVAYLLLDLKRRPYKVRGADHRPVPGTLRPPSGGAALGPSGHPRPLRRPKPARWASPTAPARPWCAPATTPTSRRTKPASVENSALAGRRV